jgi:hypothetical protein
VTKIKDTTEFAVALGAKQFSSGQHEFEFSVGRVTDGYIYIGVAVPSLALDQTFCRRDATNQVWYYFGCGFTCAFRNGWTDVVSKEVGGPAMKLPRLSHGDKVRVMLDLDQGLLRFALYRSEAGAWRELPGAVTDVRGPVVAACCIQSRSDSVSLSDAAKLSEPPPPEPRPRVPADRPFIPPAAFPRRRGPAPTPVITNGAGPDTPSPEPGSDTPDALPRPATPAEYGTELCSPTAAASPPGKHVFSRLTFPRETAFVPPPRRPESPFDDADRRPAPPAGATLALAERTRRLSAAAAAQATDAAGRRCISPFSEGGGLRRPAPGSMRLSPEPGPGGQGPGDSLLRARMPYLLSPADTRRPPPAAIGTAAAFAAALLAGSPAAPAARPAAQRFALAPARGPPLAGNAPPAVSASVLVTSPTGAGGWVGGPGAGGRGGMGPGGPGGVAVSKASLEFIAARSAAVAAAATGGGGGGPWRGGPGGRQPRLTLKPQIVAPLQRVRSDCLVLPG